MRLLVATPTELVLDARKVRHVRAEDETGAFGILPGHADFVTVLPVSVVTWRDEEGVESFVLVRRGVLMVRDGMLVEIAARGAWIHADLEQLGREAVRQLELSEEAEAELRTAETRIHLAAMRQIERLLAASRPGRAMPAQLTDDALRSSGGGRTT
ncbi:MAG: F0F1 ATP synthase subunit epsilon [Alphaproteobacteria bacterium]|nr:MAG: F0F1 ATP synthase subunit epsilon [Alphaproteobacteria bacterium]